MHWIVKYHQGGNINNDTIFLRRLEIKKAASFNRDGPKCISKDNQLIVTASSAVLSTLADVSLLFSLSLLLCLNFT